MMSTSETKKLFEVSIEHESSIVIELPEKIYSEQISLLNMSDTFLDIIFYYKEGDIRLHSRKYEQKIIKDKRYVLGFYTESCIFFPIIRKVSHERLISIDKTSNNNIESTVLRYAKFIPVDNFYNPIRLSYNRIESACGVRFNVSAEIEYNASLTLQHLQKLEQTLMSTMTAFSANIRFDNMSIKDLFFMVPPKLQFFTQFNPEDVNYVWAYKWDGIKAKLQFCQESKNAEFFATLCLDAAEIQIFPQSDFENGFTVEQLVFLKQFCFQVEVMPDCLVIIECLGTMINEKPYSVERNSNLAILSYLQSNIFSPIGRHKLQHRTIIVQKFFQPPLAVNYDVEKYDGLVIAQNNQLIKFKIPTIDVKLQQNGIFISGNEQIFPSITNPLQLPLTVGAIYEINASFEIVRHREDRNTHSTEKEVSVFRHAVTIFNQNREIFTKGLTI